jgi:hypothetical protein
LTVVAAVAAAYFPTQEDAMTNIRRGLSSLILAAALALPAGIAKADDAACQPVLDAVIKQAGVPVRQVITIESAAAPGKPLRGEIIRLGDTLYMRAGSEWIAKPYDARKAVSDSTQALQKSPHTCTRVRVDTFDGKEATLYRVQTSGAQGPTVSEIWIGGDGLPVRQQTDVQGADKAQHKVRFEYANVTAPANFRR